MGVKTLDPSDYALVSSVTTHLSGVQLLPTVDLALFERRAHSSFYMIPCFLSQLPYFFQRVLSMNSPSYPQHFTFLIYVTLPILPHLSTYIMSTFPHPLWSTSIGCGATPSELVEILLSTVFADCRIRYKPTYMSHSTIRHTTTKV